MTALSQASPNLSNQSSFAPSSRIQREISSLVQEGFMRRAADSIKLYGDVAKGIGGFVAGGAAIYKVFFS